MNFLFAIVFPIFCLNFISVESQDPDYGQVYFEESSARKAPRFHLGLGYARSISNSFLDLDSVALETEFRIWKYFSTGIFGQIIHSDESSAGDQLHRLDVVDIHTQIPEPRWGLFSLSYLQLMVGEWNLLNIAPVRADLLLGGGGGFLQKRNDSNAPSYLQLSYLWSAEQRIRFSKNFGFFISILGHDGGTFLATGLHYSID